MPKKRACRRENGEKDADSIPNRSKEDANWQPRPASSQSNKAKDEGSKQPNVVVILSGDRDNERLKTFGFHPILFYLSTFTESNIKLKAETA